MGEYLHTLKKYFKEAEDKKLNLMFDIFFVITNYKQGQVKIHNLAHHWADDSPPH